jgi:hypothetical protein
MIMITGARKGGAVRHYAHSADAHSLCGRYMIPGMGEALRDCRSCVRIGKLVGQGANDLELLAATRYNGNVAHVREVIAKPLTSSRRSFLREILRDTSGDLDPACRALYILWLEYAPNAGIDAGMYADPKRVSRSNPNAGMIDPKNARPARSILTDNQRNALIRMSNFENSLIAQIREAEGNEIPELSPVGDEFFAKLANRTEIDKAFTTISASIDKLKARLSEVKRAARVAAPVAPKAAFKAGEMVKGGVYEMDGELYRYAIAQRSGYAYALKWNGSEWDYDSARGIVRKLTPEMAISAERAKEFGHTHHCCVFCSRPLNDPRSEDAGYGSTCADNYGLPWG